MEINLVVAGSVQHHAAVVRALRRVLEKAFASQRGDLNVVLTAKPDGYSVFFARAVPEHAEGVDCSAKVRAVLEQSGAEIIDVSSDASS